MFISLNMMHLLNFKSCETKHANLISDVLPVVLWTFRLQVADKLRSHRDDTISHSFHILQPLPTNTLPRTDTFSTLTQLSNNTQTRQHTRHLFHSMLQRLITHYNLISLPFTTATTIPISLLLGTALSWSNSRKSGTVVFVSLPFSYWRRVSGL